MNGTEQTSNAQRSTVNLEGRGRIVFDESFNWLAVLKDLAAGAQLNKLDHGRLEALARNWPTCACGHLCKDLPRDSVTGAPHDAMLCNLGCDFSFFVGIGSWRCALATFRDIELRTERLLQKRGYDQSTAKATV